MTTTPLTYQCEYKDVLLKIAGVSKRKGETQILRNLDLEVRDLVRPGMQQGQVVGLLGPSGVGKTTLFRLLAGLDEPDAGQILLDKERLPVRRGMVGVVAQTYPLLAHRTVSGNLTVAGRQAGLSGGESKKKSEEILARFGLSEQRNKYPSQLSGGQRQRVAIAQQLLCSDHFLLMDEPFSGLDLLAVENVIAFIREMAALDELKTFILVTHDVSAAMQICDTLVLLGRDRDAQGKPIPGARVQATYNLVERGLAWRGDLSATPEFLQLRQEIRERFLTL